MTLAVLISEHHLLQVPAVKVLKKLKFLEFKTTEDKTAKDFRLWYLRPLIPVIITAANTDNISARKKQ